MFDEVVDLSFRGFSRREKTIIRQDVKRFEKIGRDHGCTLLDEFVEYVAERTKRDDEGYLTQKSFILFRGLGAYFGDQLIRHTMMGRFACDVRVHGSNNDTMTVMAQANPGWLVSDVMLDQHVIVPYLMTEHVFPTGWAPSLDDIFDQLIDWNQGYLIKEELDTTCVFGEDLEPVNFYAA
jgi:hypothetical protein